ncbi:hypothetical protein [Nocardia sp. NPDC059228]
MFELPMVGAGAGSALAAALIMASSTRATLDTPTATVFLMLTFISWILEAGMVF